MTGGRNVRIELYNLAKTQDAGGGITSTDTLLYSMWAKVENRSGTVLSKGQQLWSYDYKITVRQADDLPIRSNMKIKYDGKFIAIKSVSFENEGRRTNVIMRCSAIDNDV